MPIVYQTPEEFYFRIHHVRPRFKNNIENVLFFMAKEICNIGELSQPNFKTSLNSSIRQFSGNGTVEDKTINNWRTEISALFGLINYSDDIEHTNRKPSMMCKHLANEENLISFFRAFLYNFQYPGGHLKPDKILDQINNGIKFKPAKYLLELFLYAHQNDDKLGLSKAEATHCIFNDLRITRDNQAVEKTLSIIKQNKNNKTQYNIKGDIIRYAGDILDYLVLSDYLEKKIDGFYYLKKSSVLSIKEFIKNDSFFGGYDEFYNLDNVNLPEISAKQKEWLDYINILPNEDILSIDIANLLAEGSCEEKPDLNILFSNTGKVSTKQIGDLGEFCVINHEKLYLKEHGRDDLIHLIKHIPTHLAMGYDINSRGVDGSQKNIEVKTTISKNKLNVFRFHLTPNEWNVAQDNGDSYYIYRLLLSKDEISLFIIKNPVSLYKKDMLKMYIRDGAEISYNETCGEWEKVRV